MFFFSPYQAAKFLPTAYNSFAGDFSHTRHKKWAEFDTLAKDTYLYSPQKKILDIGCGNARLRKFLAEKEFSGEYYARDIAENFLHHAKKNLESFDAEIQKTFHFSQGGFLDLEKDFEENTFDEVWSVASFHHLALHTERKRALKNISKILKPNGSLILTLWNLSGQKKYIPQKKDAFWRSVWNPLFSDRDFLIPWGKQKTPRYYYSFSKVYITSLLEEAGFEIEKCFYSEKKRNLCVRATIKKRLLQPFFVKDIPFNDFSNEKVLRKMKKTLINNKKLKKEGEKGEEEREKMKKIYTPNPEMIVDSLSNPLFKRVLQNADISLPDGNGILWASGLSNIAYLEGKFVVWKGIITIYSLLSYAFFRNRYPSAIQKTICGSDIFRRFLEITQKENNVRIFLLGGEKGSAQYIQKKFPQVVAIFDDRVEKDREKEIIKKIEESRANVLFVALGAPKQEIFIDTFQKKYPKISSQLAFAMGVGGSFDFISGHQKRAPQIFQILGLEWLFRLIRYPKRAKRIWKATGKFILSLNRFSKNTEQ